MGNSVRICQSQDVLIAQTSELVSESEQASSLDGNENARAGVLEAPMYSWEVSPATNSQGPTQTDQTNVPRFTSERPGKEKLAIHKKIVIHRILCDRTGSSQNHVHL